MHALVLKGQKPVEQSPRIEQQVEEPAAGPGRSRIKVSACAICQADLHSAKGDLGGTKQIFVRRGSR